MQKLFTTAIFIAICVSFTFATRSDYSSTIRLVEFPFCGVNNTEIWCPDEHYVYSFDQQSIGGTSYDESFLYKVKMGCK